MKIRTLLKVVGCLSVASVVFLLLLSGIRHFVVNWFLFPTFSMQPTIQPGDQIFANHLACSNIADIKRGALCKSICSRKLFVYFRRQSRCMSHFSILWRGKLFFYMGQVSRSKRSFSFFWSQAFAVAQMIFLAKASSSCQEVAKIPGSSVQIWTLRPC